MKLLSLRALTNRGEAGGGGGVQADSGRPVGLSAPPAASNAPTGSFLVNAPFPSLQLRRQKSANARAAVRAATVHDNAIEIDGAVFDAPLTPTASAVNAFQLPNGPGLGSPHQGATTSPNSSADDDTDEPLTPFSFNATRPLKFKPWTRLLSAPRLVPLRKRKSSSPSRGRPASASSSESSPTPASASASGRRIRHRLGAISEAEASTTSEPASTLTISAPTEPRTPTTTSFTELSPSSSTATYVTVPSIETSMRKPLSPSSPTTTFASGELNFSLPAAEGYPPVRPKVPVETSGVATPAAAGTVAAPDSACDDPPFHCPPPAGYYAFPEAHARAERYPLDGPLEPAAPPADGSADAEGERSDADDSDGEGDDTPWWLRPAPPPRHATSGPSHVQGLAAVHFDRRVVPASAGGGGGDGSASDGSGGTWPPRGLTSRFSDWTPTVTDSSESGSRSRGAHAPAVPALAPAPSIDGATFPLPPDWGLGGTAATSARPLLLDDYAASTLSFDLARGARQRMYVERERGRRASTG